MKKEFQNTDGDFSAYNAAVKWLSGLGYSCGSMQNHAPTAIFRGDCAISKWRNLSGSERAAADGRIVGDFFNGPVTVTLKHEPQIVRPVRLQRSRRKGSKLVSPNGLPVKSTDRSTKYGNPFKIGEVGPMGRKAIDKEGAVGFFEAMPADPELRAAANYPSDEVIRNELRGKNICCWCKIGEACHADVLLKFANGEVES